MPSSPVQMTTSAGSIGAPSGQAPPRDRLAASARAMVVLPVPAAPASRCSFPQASQFGHSQSIASG